MVCMLKSTSNEDYKLHSVLRFVLQEQEVAIIVCQVAYKVELCHKLLFIQAC